MCVFLHCCVLCWTMIWYWASCSEYSKKLTFSSPFLLVNDQRPTIIKEFLKLFYCPLDFFVNVRCVRPGRKSISAEISEMWAMLMLSILSPWRTINPCSCPFVEFLFISKLTLEARTFRNIVDWSFTVGWIFFLCNTWHVRTNNFFFPEIAAKPIALDGIAQQLLRDMALERASLICEYRESLPVMP